MTKINHTLSGILFAEAVVATMYPGVLTAGGISHVLSDGQSLETLAPVVAACVIGPIFPDIDIGIPGLPHRSLTHWFLPYAGLLIFAYLTGRFPLLFFSAGCLLHILLDSFSMMGVPILNPFGKRKGFGMMTVGGSADLVISLLFILALVMPVIFL